MMPTTPMKHPIRRRLMYLGVQGLRVVVQAKEDVEDMLAERKARADTAKEVNAT